MTAREKVVEAERQVRAVVSGIQAHVDCPFCGLTSTPENEVLCCDSMAEVTDAVLNHVGFKNQMETLERVGERMSALEANFTRVNPLVMN